MKLTAIGQDGQLPTITLYDHLRMVVEMMRVSLYLPKLRQVLQEVLGQNGENLLWIPPSLPCYPLAGAFADTTGFSKTLIFSAWLMVPRMLSSLISFEVERRTIGNPDSIDPQEKEARKYFHAKTERRHPIPQLVFSQKRTEAGESAGNMSNFTLLYPSHTLANLFNPSDTLIRQRSQGDIRSELVSIINGLIVDAELHRFGTSTGESDKWYWAAEAAVIAWMRHQTTGYDDMVIPRVKGKRREVRRMLARRSHDLLEGYRRGEPVPADCPLRRALVVLNGDNEVNDR